MSISKKRVISWRGLVTGKVRHLPDPVGQCRTQTTEETTVARSEIAGDLEKLKSITESFSEEEKKSTNVKRFISRATLILKIAGP